MPKNCPKCKSTIHVTVRDEGARRHGAKCGCGWEGFFPNESKIVTPPRGTIRR